MNAPHLPDAGRSFFLTSFAIVVPECNLLPLRLHCSRSFFIRLLPFLLFFNPFQFVHFLFLRFFRLFCRKLVSPSAHPRPVAKLEMRQVPDPCRRPRLRSAPRLDKMSSVCQNGQCPVRVRYVIDRIILAWYLLFISRRSPLDRGAAILAPQHSFTTVPIWPGCRSSPVYLHINRHVPP